MSLWSTQHSMATMDNTSNRSSDEYIDDALITDSVKKLLSGDHSDGHHFDLTADILTNASNAANPEDSGGEDLPVHEGAKLQDGLDLVDALDSLIQDLNRAAAPKPLQQRTLEAIIQDHNYCSSYTYCLKVSADEETHHSSVVTISESAKSDGECLQSPLKSNANIASSPPFTSFNDNSYASSSTASATSPSPTRFPGSPTTQMVRSPPKTPTASRRSQRQIERIEKSVLEKIKAENQEMLKREKESMVKPTAGAEATPTSAAADDVKDTDDSQLVIDLDKKKEHKIQSNNKKRLKQRPKPPTIEPTNKKSRMDCQPSIGSKPEALSTALDSKQETSELDDVIAALSGVTDPDDKTLGTGRQQRTRRKPKRWDDDEVEVDFSGQLGILAEEQKSNSVENDENCVENKEEIREEVTSDQSIKPEVKDVKEKESKVDSEEDMDDEEEGSDFGSEDDPDKLWCICRQPHDERFMIGCDSCEEWFHGTCVNVTKQQGRNMEKAGQEWLCQTCVKGISDGVPRDELKRVADGKRAKLEAEERVRAQTKRMAKEKFLKKEKSRELSKQRLRRDSSTDSSEVIKKKLVQKQVSAEKPTQKPPMNALSAKKVSQMPPKKRELHLRLESEESEKLKKLIKSSKKDLNKKRELMNKSKSTGPKQRLGPELEPISKVVPIVRKPEVKKKHKDAFDPSVQDLFKAEPIKKTSISTPPTPTTPGTPGATPFSRKASVDTRRISTSAPIERLCPSGCGKSVRNETSIYCTHDCIEIHVNETLKQLRTARREKYESGVKIREIDRRVVLVEKSSGRLLSGKDAIPEKDVLEYIKANPLFECFRPSLPKDKRKEESSLKSIITPQKSPKKEDKPKASISRSNSRSGDFEGGDPIRSNVRTTLKETLINRCKEANESLIDSKDIQRIAFKVEEELFKVFNKDTSGKYRNKYRSLIFNLKDTKNQGLFRKVVNGKISPERLVQMSAEELASSELAKWREREKITMLEMIKRDAADKVNQVIVKKTHKGEELIENIIISETANEAKSDDHKALTPNSTPISGVSTLLDDLMGTSQVDTTAQHKTHLFSNNCRICTNKTDDKSESKRSSAPSSSREDPSSRPTPKRVRVDPDSANKILLEAAKLSSTLPKRSTSADDEDSHEVPTSTVSLSSPEAPSSSSASRPVWKGSIFMQDVAKFAANAVKISGTVGDFLSQDISTQITVCGRIAPEQVLDYVKKLKYSSRTEIGLVKFVSPKDERIGYDAFFDYLNSRGRYGVVNIAGKFSVLKDFYILPLPKSKDVPEVLLPFDGPGLDKKSLRPNLLLGILIRKHVGSQPTHTSSTNTSQTKTKPLSNSSEFRSYTPPPKTSSNESSPEDNKESEDVSYTPPHMSTATAAKQAISTKTAADDDEPYDPGEADMSNSNSLSNQSTESIHELMDKIAKSSNPVEMTSSVLSAIASSSNLELQRKLLEQLTAKVDEQKKQLEEQKAEAEANATGSSTAGGGDTTLIPGLDGQFTSLKDITIPDNLQDILSTVQQKTQEIEQQQERLRAVAASGFKYVDPIVQNFGSKTFGASETTEDETPEAEPMDLDEEVTPTKTTIIEVNTPVSAANSTESAASAAIDPRLRSKKQTPLPSITQESGAESRVAAMTADELMHKARQQMAALAQMAKSEPTVNSESPAGREPTAPTTSKKSPKIKIQWKKKK